MELKTNSSNNTIFADASGHIAYFHGNYMPKRDVAFDWTKPVDGSNPATEYKGLHSIDETPNLLDPKAGWLYNANDFPWWAAGKDSLKKDAYPVYVESGTASARGVHALKSAWALRCYEPKQQLWSLPPRYRLGSKSFEASVVFSTYNTYESFGALPSIYLSNHLGD